MGQRTLISLISGGYIVYALVDLNVQIRPFYHLFKCVSMYVYMYHEFIFITPFKVLSELLHSWLHNRSKVQLIGRLDM